MTQTWRVTLELEYLDPSDEDNPDDPGAWSEVFVVEANDATFAQILARIEAHTRHDDVRPGATLHASVNRVERAVPDGWVIERGQPA